MRGQNELEFKLNFTLLNLKVGTRWDPRANHRERKGNPRANRVVAISRMLHSGLLHSSLNRTPLSTHGTFLKSKKSEKFYESVTTIEEREMLTPAQITSWRSRGCCVVDSFIPLSIARSYQHTAHSLNLKNLKNFGGVGFPFMNSLDMLAMDETLISACGQLLDCDELLLSQAECWVKKGDDVDGMHQFTKQSTRNLGGDDGSLAGNGIDDVGLVNGVAMINSGELDKDALMSRDNGGSLHGNEIDDSGLINDVALIKSGGPGGRVGELSRTVLLDRNALLGNTGSLGVKVNVGSSVNNGASFNDASSLKDGSSTTDYLSMNNGSLTNNGPSMDKVLSKGNDKSNQANPAATGSPPEYANTDQRIHMDFPNHTLTHPSEWNNPEAVAIIVYLDEGAGGETAYVERQGSNDKAYEWPYVHMPGFGNVPWINDKTLAEEYLQTHHPDAFRFRQKLYAREKRVQYKLGTVLFYRLDLWHRGTPLNLNRNRAVMNLLFKKRDVAHITSWHRGWAHNAYNTWSLNALGARVYPPAVGEFERLIARLSPIQRTVLGFPHPGHVYWTEETLRAVQARYPSIDLTPYSLKLCSSKL